MGGQICGLSSVNRELCLEHWKVKVDTSQAGAQMLVLGVLAWSPPWKPQAALKVL